MTPAHQSRLKTGQVSFRETRGSARIRQVCTDAQGEHHHTGAVEQLISSHHAEKRDSGIQCTEEHARSKKNDLTTEASDQEPDRKSSRCQKGSNLFVKKHESSRKSCDHSRLSHTNEQTACPMVTLLLFKETKTPGESNPKERIDRKPEGWKMHQRS